MASGNVFVVFYFNTVKYPLAIGSTVRSEVLTTPSYCWVTSNLTLTVLCGSDDCAAVTPVCMWQIINAWHSLI